MLKVFIASVVIGTAAVGRADTPPTVTLSRDETDTTPLGVRFNGPFANDALVASVSGLPTHAYVAVEFDLLVLRSWDGSVPHGGGQKEGVGPDSFRVAVEGGPVLLETTFSNVPNEPGFWPDSQSQNYPSAVPGDRLPAGTGATSRNTLGYHYPYPGPANLVGMDAVYRVRLVVPHVGPSVAIRLSGRGLSSLVDESWGVRNLAVVPLAAADAGAPREDSAYAELFNAAVAPPDPLKPPLATPEAVNRLVAGGDRTVRWIGQNVCPVAVDAVAIRSAVSAIFYEDDRLDDRDTAGERLAALGPATEPYLRDAWQKARGEARVRIDEMLARLATTPIDSADARRVALATRVLEVIGTTDAYALRAKLVGMN